MKVIDNILCVVYKWNCKNVFDWIAVEFIKFCNVHGEIKPPLKIGVASDNFCESW